MTPPSVAAGHAAEQSPSQSPAPSDSRLSVEGEMGERIRAIDWSHSPLGPRERWPGSLSTALGMVLGSRYPMFLWWGPQLINLYNDAYLPLLGRRHPAALGRPAHEVWADIWATVGPLADAVMRDNRATWHEDLLLVMQRNGYTEETFFTFSYSPVVDESGRVGAVFCACTETTSRVLVERRLAALRHLAAHSRARSTAQACEAAAHVLGQHARDVPFALIYLIEADGRHAHLQAASGLAVADSCAPSLIALQGDISAEFWPLASALAGRTVPVRGLDQRASLPGGPWPEPVHTALIIPLKGPQGQPIGFLVGGVSPRRPLDDDYQGFFELVAGGLASSITDARAYEQERARAEALARLDRAKTDFFGNVSHELRTPLTLLLGPLEDELRRDPHPSENLVTAARNGRRLRKLVDALLDFSRMEAGRVRAHYTPTDLAGFTADLASGFRSAMDAAGLRYVLNTPPLPEPVFVDRDMWEKIVLNLVGNAFKFTLRGGVEISLGARGGRAELTVADTGCGLPADELPRVFERFHRVRGAVSRSHEGTGIGLALVRELAHLHGGEVSVTSEEGKGSAFTVSIPFGTSHLPADQVGVVPFPSELASSSSVFAEEVERWLPESEPPPLDRVATPSARLLIVDDNADMRDYLRRLLAPVYEVEVAVDGESALASIHRRPPDLVLTDAMMPRLDGFGLLERVRADALTRSLPVILLSARAGEESRVEGLDAGADDYLVKPFSSRELLARIRSQLELAKVRREGAENISRILENITDGFNTIDAEGCYTSFNASARAILAEQGLAADSLLGKNIFELFPDLLATPGGEALRRTLSERAPTSTETYFPRWNRWYWIRNQPLPDGGVATFIQDITEQKQAEEKLRASEDRYRAFIANSTEGIWRLEFEPPLDTRLPVEEQVDLAYRHGLFAECNEVMARMYGLSGPGDLVGRSLALMLPPDDPGSRAYLASVVRSGYRVSEVESAERDVAGNTLHFSNSMAGVIENGLLRTLWGTQRDITERKGAEEAMRRGEERFRSLVSIVADVPWTTDPQGNFVAPQASWENYTGQTFEQHRGLGWLDALHPDDRERILADWNDAVRHRARYRTHGRIWHAPSLGYRHFTGQATPLLEENGEVREWIGAYTDVHEERVAAEHLEHLVSERTAALEEKIAEIETFSYSIAHDMRAPLRSMRGFADILIGEHADRLDSEAREFLARIAASATRMDKLIQDILGYSRVMQGAPPRERVEPAELLRGMIQSYPQLSPDKVDICIEEPMPAVLGSEAMLTQVFSNLLGNAVKFVTPGTRPAIRVRAGTTDDTVRIQVQDNGIGIPPHQHDKIFAIFQQLDRGAEGTGIGLAIVKKAVERMGGRVTLESALGAGSTFTVELPRG